LAIYLSLTLLGLGAGIGRAEDKKPFFNTPPSHELRLDKIPKPPMEFSLSGCDDSEPQYKFSLVPQNGAGFSLVPDRTAMVLSTAPAARSLEGIVESAPSQLQDREYQQTPVALYKGEKQATEKKGKWWVWPVAIIGAVAASYGAYKLFFEKKHTPEPPQPPTYKETTLVLSVKDVLTKTTLANIVAEYDDIDANGNTVHETYTTDGSGNATIKYKEATSPNIKFSGANYNTRSTYIKWLANNEVTLIPATFDMDTYKIVIMGGGNSAGKIRRWTKQPSYIIVTQDMDDTTKGYIYDVLKTNEIELLTGGKIKGTTTPTEVTARIDYPANNTFVYEFRNDFTTDSVASTTVISDPNTFEITGVIVSLNVNKRANVRRQTLLHESGHGVGHWGEGTQHLMLMGDSSHYVGYVTQWDIDNGTVAYNRPCGNTYPDNDPATGGANAMIQNAANMMMPMQVTFTPPSITGSSRIGSILRTLNLPTGFHAREGSMYLAADILGGAVLGFDNGKGSVNTTLSNIGGPLESITNALIKGKNVTAGAQMVHSQWQNLYQAGATAAALPGIDVMVFDAYDANRKINTLNLGTSIFDKKLQLSYGSQTGGNSSMQVFNAQTQFGIGNVVINANGSVAKYNPDELSLALNLSAKLGTAVVLGSYSHEQLRQMSQDFGRLAVMLPLGPGFVDASLFKMPGKKPWLSAKYTVQFVF
jgi:hypothetical protein